MLGRRDAALTLIAAAAVIVVVANVRNWQLPVVAGDRATVAVLGLLGLLMARAAPRGRERTDAIRVALDVLGVGVVFLVVGGLAIGTHVVLVLLTTLLTLVSLLLILHHLGGAPDRPEQAGGSPG